MQNYICIHGHFYQPPRENAWLESIELQDSAAPYHDWNERIFAECYAPNATARILNGENQITEITNNYSRISFNFGPTLLAWMKEKMPEIHQAIVKADGLSRERFSGHGSAMAQVYNHMILPLANRGDKYTQVLWGIRDFESRFGRMPEGMWLSETAADTETFEVLAELGIKFTVLSPFQASRVRRIGGRNWKDVNGAQIDPSMPYLVNLPSGKTISLFFYDAPVSQAVAFEKLLGSGERFANRLMSGFCDRGDRDQLMHIATDGESYGHHHRYGEMAMAYALHHIESNNLARLTNYGEYLASHPPTHEVQIHEKSSWSCSHGVGRWERNCGCNSGGTPWNQEWRTPLRQALDWLRDAVSPLYVAAISKLLKDPWTARNEYINVILDRSPEGLAKFFGAHATHELSDEERVAALKLLELQRHAMLMYTSCGWFFDELSGIETVQVIQYAGRVLQLAKELFEHNLEEEFLTHLEKAKSNLPDHGDGRVIYEKFVRPAMVDWEKVVAHYAVSSIFNPYSETTNVFVFGFEDPNRKVFEAGKAKLAIGKVKVSFQITKESSELCYAVLYMGEHNMTGGVGRFPDDAAYQTMSKEVSGAFEKADFPQAIRLIDQHFSGSSYSLASLFKDEQRRILDLILKSVRDDLENRYRLVAEQYTPLMRFLKDLNAPLPEALQVSSDYVLQADIKGQFERDDLELGHLKALLKEAQARNLSLANADLCYLIKNRLESMISQVATRTEGDTTLMKLETLAAILFPLGLNLNLWKVQNTYYEMLQNIFPQVQTEAEAGNESARAWAESFRCLGKHLGFALNPT